MIFGIIYGIILSLLAVFLITIAVKGGQMLYFFTRSEDTEVGLSYAVICIIHIIPLIYHRNNPVIMFIIAALVGNMLAGLLISTKKTTKIITDKKI